MVSSELRNTVLNKVNLILEKPRVSAYTPQALVEVVCTLLSLAYNETKFQKHMFKEYNSTSKPWWLNEDLDYQTATLRLRRLAEFLSDGNFEL